LGQLLDQRRGLYGTHESYIRAHELLSQLRAAVVQWRAEAPSRQTVLALRDAQGNWVPSRHCLAFQTANQIFAVGRTLTDMGNLVERLSQQPGGQLLHSESVVSQHPLAAAQAVLKACPWIVCPHCHGTWQSCTYCLERGWLTYSEAQKSPPS